MATDLIHLSGILKRPLVDAWTGDKLGRVQDLVARMDASPHPPIVGLVVKIGGRELFVPARKISAIEPGRVTFDGAKVDLRRFERRPGELLLAKDLMARHLINLVGARLIRANEIELARTEHGWEVVGVDPTTRGLVRRLLPGRLGQHSAARAIVDWGSIEPFVSHVPTARLHIPYRKLARLHPARIADLVEQASHEEGEEIIEAVGQDPALEADVFEELDPEHQVEFVQNRSDRRSSPASRVDGARRRRRHDLRDRPGTAGSDSRAAPRAAAPEGPVAPPLPPRDGRRPHEPRLLGVARHHDGRRGAGRNQSEHGATRGAGRRVRLRSRRRARLRVGLGGPV